MNVNSRLREFYPDSEELFDIVLMTNNHAQVGVRLINSINHYGTLHPGIWTLTSDLAEIAAATALKMSNDKPPRLLLRLIFLPRRLDNREILYDWREKSNRLPEGLHHKPVPLQRFPESDGGHRGR